MAMPVNSIIPLGIAAEIEHAGEKPPFGGRIDIHDGPTGRIIDRKLLLTTNRDISP